MENLLNYKGTHFSARISGKMAAGKIQIENNEVYLCQDVIDGSHCADRLGYKYSWAVGNGNVDILKYYDISDFKLHYTTAQIEEYKDWTVGDIVFKENQGSYKVIFRSGELVILKNLNTDRASSPYTCDELHNAGFRLKATPINDEEDSIEVTIDEIAKLLKTSPEKIRIKKEG